MRFVCCDLKYLFFILQLCVLTCMFLWSRQWAVNVLIMWDGAIISRSGIHINAFDIVDLILGCLVVNIVLYCETVSAVVFKCLTLLQLL